MRVYKIQLSHPQFLNPTCYWIHEQDFPVCNVIRELGIDHGRLDLVLFGLLDKDFTDSYAATAFPETLFHRFTTPHNTHTTHATHILDTFIFTISGSNNIHICVRQAVEALFYYQPYLIL